MGPSGPGAQGPNKTNFYKNLIIFYIYNASALKRIIANQLGYKVYQTLKFQFWYY